MLYLQLQYYIHGNSLIFANVRKCTNEQETDICQFCEEEQDSPEHQLFHCKDLEDRTSEELKSRIQNTTMYQKEIIFAKDNQIQLAFIHRVAYLEQQHEAFLQSDTQ